MTMPDLVLTRVFRAPRERVFAAFVEREELMAWFGPEGMSIPSCSIDARVGGSYRVEMHGSEGGVHVVSGEFRELAPPRRLSFTWAWQVGAARGPDSLVTVEFRELGDGTEITLTHSGLVDAASRNGHENGWTSSFNCLDASLAGRREPPTARPTILGDPRSTYVRSVRMAFAEKDISCAVQAHMPHSDAVRAIHPMGKIPVFTHCGFQLFEASAIMHYADSLPGPALMPQDPKARCQVEQWISAINSYFHDAAVRRVILQYLFPKGTDGKPDRGIIDPALAQVGVLLAAFERAYGERDFLVGDAVSIADLLLAPIIDYLGRVPEGPGLLATHAGVARAHQAMAARPSFTSARPPG